MASNSHHILISLLLCSILLINRSAKCDDTLDQEDNLLQGINRFRASLNLSALIENDNAECLADDIVDQFRALPCTNTSSFNVTGDIRLQIANYPTIIAKCDLNANRTSDGVILPACLPNPTLVPALLLSNYTTSQYSQYLNDSKFTGIGIQTEDNWTVVILTTNTSAGSFVPIDDKDDVDETDEDDNLFQGINSFRAALNLTPLTENEKAECLADKIADTFDNQLCAPNASGAVGAYTPASPQFSNYNIFLRECGLTINTTRAGIILPACVPNLVPTFVVSNYTRSQYSQYLNGTNYSGIGIGTEDNWVVVVLTTNTADGSFIAANSVGTGDFSRASELAPIFSYLTLLATGLLVLLC